MRAIISQDLYNSGPGRSFQLVMTGRFPGQQEQSFSDGAALYVGVMDLNEEGLTNPNRTLPDLASIFRNLWVPCLHLVQDSPG